MNIPLNFLIKIHVPKKSIVNVYFRGFIKVIESVIEIQYTFRDR